MYDRGLMKNDQMSRYNGKVNIDHRINKVVKVGSSLLYTYKNWNRRKLWRLQPGVEDDYHHSSLSD